MFRLISQILVFLCCLAQGLQASAQSGVNSTTEKLEITGSRIKRIDVEGPSPVLTIDRDALQKSGYNSVADVLRDSTVSSFGVEREDTDETNSIGAATVGLRGLSSDKTLVLLDGRRLPKIDGGNSVDLNLIPFEALERVEILKDGASAIYGSDALAGVINFITRKDYDGTNIKMRYSQPEQAGGVRQEVSATYGSSSARRNFLAVYQYRNNQRIMDQDRPWSRGGYSTYSTPPTVRTKNGAVKSVYKAAPNCPADRVSNSSDGSSACLFDYSKYTSSLPDTEQHSALIRGDVRVGDTMKLFATTTVTRRQVRWQMAPSADDLKDNRELQGKNYSIPQSVAGKTGFENPPGDLELRYRSVNELGARSSRDTTTAFGTAVGVQGELGDSWDWETSVNYGASELYNLRHAGYGNTQNLYSAIVEGKIRPFDSSTKASAIPGVQHTGEQWIRTNITTAQALSSGLLADVGWSQFNVAAGTSASWEAYKINVDDVTNRGDLFGGIGENGQGQRNFQSVFTELAWNVGPAEIQLAGRYDNYSDFGGTLNPKISARYQPFRAWVLRASAGTGFRAPSLDELYSSSSYNYPWFVDQSACNQFGGDACSQKQHRVFSGGNPNLQEETSFSYNIGTVVQPTKALSLSLDLWQTKIENAVGMDFNDLMLAETRLPPGQLEALGINIIRTNGTIDEIVAPNINLATQESRGLEFGANWNLKMGPWNVTPRIDHSQLLRNEEEVFPGLGTRSKLGEYGRPRWKNMMSVSISGFQHGLRLAARTVAGQYKQSHQTDPSDTGRLSTYTEYDTHYDYFLGKSSQLSFGVKNVLGSRRPIDDTAGFSGRLNSQLYDQVGRLFYAGFSQQF